jgi:hypothetical protein
MLENEDNELTSLFQTKDMQKEIKNTRKDVKS